MLRDHVKEKKQNTNRQHTNDQQLSVSEGFLIRTLKYWRCDEFIHSFCWLQCSSSVYCKALFPLLLGWLSNNSYPGEDGAKSSFAFWSEGRQFNWKCKLRSHVSPQWNEPWVTWMCTLRVCVNLKGEGWMEGEREETKCMGWAKLSCSVPMYF